MTYDQFVAKWNGVGADFDGWYGDQCVDLFNFYNRDVVGQGFDGTPTTGGAADLWNDYQSLPGYTKVANSPTGIPPKGAVVIWAANTKATGAAGHVGMASGEGDTTYFVSFDQNYPTGSLPHMQRHSYDGVLGWYVPINNQGGDNVTIPDQDNWYWRFNKLMQQIRGRDLGRPEFQKNFVGVEDFHMVEILSDDAEADAAQNAQTVGQVAVRDNWQGQITTLQQQLADAQAQTKAQGGTIDLLNKELADAGSKVTELQTALKAAQAPLVVTMPGTPPVTTGTGPMASPAVTPTNAQALSLLERFVAWLKSLLS